MAKLTKQRTTVNPYKKVIKIHPFDNAQIALNIIAKICSWVPQDNNITLFSDFERVALSGENSSDNIQKYFLEKRQQRDIMNLDFWNELIDRLIKIKIELDTKEREVKAKIIVAGSINAGKSSFLNKVFQTPELLPTDIKACSLIPTYIYSSANIHTEQETKILGLNFKNVVGPLDFDVLQYIRHESTNNIYISSVLEKLFIEIKENDNIKGLAFIDTPGYNYQDESDKDKAIQSLSEGNVLFWVIDIATGVITNSDKQFIKEYFTGKHIVIIFNKADILPADTVTNILKEAKYIFKDQYDSGQLLDIIAFSSFNDDAYQSVRGYKLEELFDKIRLSGDKYSRIDVLIQQIQQLFQDEIDACGKSIEQSEILLKEKNKDKLDVFQFVNSDQIDNDTFIRNLKSVLLESYDELDHTVDTLASISDSTYSELIDYYNKVFEWNNDKFFRSDAIDEINTQTYKIINAIKQRREKEIKGISCYTKEARQGLVNTVEKELNKLNDMYRDHFLSTLQEQCDSYSSNIEKQNQMIEELKQWQDTIVETLKISIKQCKKNMGNQYYEEIVPDSQQIDIFTAIQNDDKMSFMLCFKDGLNIEELYDDDGYTPLTYAVKLGANDFVQFFIDQNVDLGFKDQRGYNAYLTAVENNYKDLCKLLADARPDLIQSLSADNKNAIKIAEENKFCDWLKNNMKRI